MPDNSTPGIGDLLTMVGGSSLFTGITKAIGQFQRGVGDFLHAVENFNETMHQMNGIAKRVNVLLDEVEPAVKAFMPQITRTLQAADSMVEQLSVPVDRVAPGLARLADLLASPALTALPKDLSEFVAVMGDLAKRMQPLGQLAETAGGLFGLKQLSSFMPSRSATPAAAPARPAAPPPTPPPAPVKKSPAKKSSARGSAAKKAPAARTAPAAKRAPSR